MDFSLTDDQRMILDTVRTFRDRELIPLRSKVQEADMEGKLFPDPDTLRALQLKAKEAGLWSLDEPIEYGGAALPTLTMALIAMETSRSLVPFRYGGWVPKVLYKCNKAQEAAYLLPALAGTRKFAFALSEPNGASDAANMQTTAVKQGDKWVINGAKMWITGGHAADFAIVWAITDREKGHRGGITAFLVDREMGWTSREIPVMATSELAHYPPAELYFDNVEVPEENVLGEVGNGFKMAISAIGASRITTPARSIGMCQTLLEMAIDYANVRKLKGHPIADFQAIQWMIADCGVELQTARLLFLHAAWKSDQGGDVRYEQSMAKLYGAQVAGRIADRVLQIHGAFGYSRELPIERCLRQMRVHRIYEGSDEVQKANVADALLKGKASPTAEL
jgi:acyl-CoA dehydrogenase